MSEGRCPLCGTGNARWCRRQGLRRCTECDHRFAAGLPLSVDPAHLYEESYFRGAVYRDYLGEAHWRTKAFAAKLQLVAGYLPGSGNVLDVGCAAGFFTALMRKRGHRVWGVEPSGFAARHARETPGVEVFVGELPEAGFPSGFFDLISFWDTLEHLPDPVGVACGKPAEY